MIPLRDENPLHHRQPVFTVLLIIVNVLVFFYEQSLGQYVEGFVYQFGVLPVEITRQANLRDSQMIPPNLTLLTSMFLHGGWMHLIGNMWFLWIFGDNIEDSIGHFGFLLFYLLTGVLAGLTHVFLHPMSTIPTLGASGAISGVLGAYLVLHPRIRIKTLLPLGILTRIIYVPAGFFLLIWFGMQLLGGMGRDSGVAFGAHIGGFVAGVLLIFFFSKQNPHRPTARYETRRVSRWRWE
jgi:membrane associated rhomboid family serine protease